MELVGYGAKTSKIRFQQEKPYLKTGYWAEVAKSQINFKSGHDQNNFLALSQVED